MVHTSLGKSDRKGISLVGIMQKFPDDATAQAWFLAHHLRIALAEKGSVFDGSVEAEETYFSSRCRNMSNAKHRQLKDSGRGAVCKATSGVQS